ncbi:hypothetical protein CLIB1444_12S02080 [[Candida] jaroonii]|uniref:Uncharacterized protein n=1 Tax=[Candida] jaroonii TaxID=467808 RepID=A0ACA9YEB6_9ASCO|nr:hypothetical protein CLIB1444_12S02080 [[Candida] jaroonii]
MGDFKKPFESISWNDIKRFPQSFKRRSKIGSFTFDEEFDTLHKDLGVLEGNLGTLIKYSKLFDVHSKRLVDHCGEIGVCVQNLMDPYNNFDISVRESLRKKGIGELSESMFKSTEAKEMFFKEYTYWNASGIYIEQINGLKQVINGPSRVCEIIELKCKKCLAIIEEVKIKVKARNHALDDYDSVYNDLEGLCFKAKTKDLTAKEAQLQFNLQRKREHYRTQYTQINDLFKKELPFFFKLVELFIKPINYIFFYHQLSISYQIATSLYPLQQTLKFGVDELGARWNGEVIRQCQRLMQSQEMLIQQLNISHFRDNYYKKLTDSDVKTEIKEVIESVTVPDYLNLKNTYCRALYDYQAQQDGDLTIQKGDIIQVIDQEGQWWEGKIDNNTGKFPYNYVEILT